MSVHHRAGIPLVMAEEDEWEPWSPDIDTFIDPMDFIKHTAISVLTIYGELDKNIDPVQGVEAYVVALQLIFVVDHQF